jgi:hypothetical protein
MTKASSDNHREVFAVCGGEVYEDIGKFKLIPVYFENSTVLFVVS